MTIFRSRRRAPAALAAAFAAAGWALPVPAGEADVVAVEFSVGADGRFSFDVTVAHADDGWSHYADRFEILDLEGNLLGTRVLLHPHDEELPFTRSLTGVEIPGQVFEVIVRAHDNVHGFGGAELRLPIR